MQTKLMQNKTAQKAVQAMEDSGGEPDVVAYDATDDCYVFMDCALQSPQQRRGLCYDQAAWEARKSNKSIGNALTTASKMGIELLSEEDYRYLQTLGEFDTKTSSWLQTPAFIRERGGAIFGDRRYDTVFVYHNGAESYYAARGFRGKVKV